MNEMLSAALLWVVTHLGVSSTPLRGWLVKRIGQGPYLLLYSLLATATLAYLVYVYVTIVSFDYLWVPNPNLYWFAKLLLPFAFVLLVGGFMVKNPSMVGMSVAQVQADADAGRLATGVTRITRHPFQWAVILWAATHVIANGDLRSVIFFTSFFLLSLFGTVLMDMKKRASLGAVWARYEQATSNVPFVALLQGRNQWCWGEFGLPVLVGLVTYGIVYLGHEWLTGAPVI
ncbi:MAG: NnrU family protein [Pseudomonadota bacterium]